MQFLKPDKYQPRLTKIFSEMKEVLNFHLPYAGVEHIGSSAIEGAVSKGDLDILVRVSESDFVGAVGTLEMLGFAIKEDTLRSESLCMLHTTLFGTEVAVQLIESGSKFEDFVKFRDYMNANPKAVKEYNALKQSCAGLEPSDYRARKAEYIEKVLRG